MLLVVRERVSMLTLFYLCVRLTTFRSLIVDQQLSPKAGSSRKPLAPLLGSYKLTS